MIFSLIHRFLLNLNFRTSVANFEQQLDKLDEIFITLGYLGEFVIGNNLQNAINRHMTTLEHGIGRIWPKAQVAKSSFGALW